MAGQREHRLGVLRIICRNDSERLLLVLAHLGRTALRREFVGQRLLKWRTPYERGWKPNAAGAGRLEDFDVRGDFKAPPIGQGWRVGKKRDCSAKCHAGKGRGAVSQEFPSVHTILDVDRRGGLSNPQTSILHQ